MFTRLLANKIYEKTKAFLPENHRIRYRYAVARMVGYEDEWSWLNRVGPNHGNAVDIGANEGIYAWRMAAMYRKVYAFEPNTHISQDLRSAQHPKIELHDVALSSSSGSTTFYVPIQGRRELSGWGSLNPHNHPGEIETRKMTVPMATLDSFHLEDVKMIKIDVEGHEIEVVKGALETIGTAKPVILAEIGGDNLPGMDSLLMPLGYQRRSLLQEVGRQGYAHNWWYLPDRQAA